MTAVATAPARTDRTEPPPPAITVRGLRRRYGGDNGFEAVRGVDFEVRPGELFGLLGTNGAGKTSTLEVVEGLAPATAGEVSVLGLDPWTDRDRVRPHLGIMLQTGGFPGALTVRETAAMWAGTLAHARPVDEALDLVRISHRRDVDVAQLSGGERRRLDLALALLNEPSILFLDEPTTGLDPESRRNLWSLISDLKDAGTAIVLTTHYLDEVESLADRLAIMHRGRIRISGTVADIVSGFPASIRFREVETSLPELPAVVASRVVDGRRVLDTGDLQQTLATLLDWADRHRITLDGLEARSASLESVFLSYADSLDEDPTTDEDTTLDEHPTTDEEEHR